MKWRKEEEEAEEENLQAYLPQRVCTKDEFEHDAEVAPTATDAPE